MSEIWNTIQVSASEAAKNIQNYTVEAAKNLPNYTSVEMETVGSLTSEAAKSFPNYTSVAMETVGNFTSEAVKNFPNYTSEVVNDVKYYAPVAMENLKNYSSEVVDKAEVVYNNATYIWDHCDASKMSPYIDVGQNFVKTAALIFGYVLLGYIVVALAMCLIGFTCGGIAGGSAAAAWQSSIGNVMAGSCFSILQSCGAGFCNTFGLSIIVVLTIITSLLSIYVMCFDD